MRLFNFIVLVSLFIETAYGQFKYKSLSPEDDYRLLNSLKERLKTQPYAHSFPLLPYMKADEFGPAIFSYFTRSEAEEIFGSVCERCRIRHSSKEVLDGLYGQIAPKVLTYIEAMAQSGGSGWMERVKTPYFTEEQSLEILKAAELLKMNIPKGHRVLFLGRSGLWIYHAFQLLSSLSEPQHKTLQVSFSGRPNLPRLIETEDFSLLFKSIVTPQKRAYFRSYLERCGLDLSDHVTPIVIVDYIESGESLLSFLKLLTRYYLESGHEIPDLSIYDLGDASPFTSSPSDYKKRLIENDDGSEEYWFDDEGDFRITYHSLGFNNDDPLLSLLVNAEDDTLLAPYYPAYRWTEEYDIERDEIRYPAALRIQSELLEVWNHHLGR
ncbi:hypothetical protein EBS43_01525 [bacterium]|nr:hypothetical protein [bacterium]